MVKDIKQKITILLDNQSEEISPQIAKKIYEILIPLLDDQEHKDTNKQRLEPITKTTMMQEFYNDLGTHGAGKVVDFTILLALSKLTRAKTLSTLHYILRRAGIPNADSFEFEPALRTRLHRMMNNKLISKRGDRRSAHYQIRNAGTERMAAVMGDSGDPVIDQYLKMTRDDVIDAISSVNEASIDANES